MAPPLRSFWKFAPDGKFIREIGHNIYAWSYAHAVRVDSHDNVWVATKARTCGPLQSRRPRDLVLGRKTEASDENSHPWETSQSALAAD